MGPFQDLAKSLASVYPETVPCHNCGKEGKEAEMHRAGRLSRNETTGVSIFSYSCPDCHSKGIPAGRKEAHDMASRRLYDPTLSGRVKTKPLFDMHPLTRDILKALGL